MSHKPSSSTSHHTPGPWGHEDSDFHADYHALYSSSSANQSKAPAIDYSPFLPSSMEQSGRKVTDPNSAGYLFCRTFIDAEVKPDSSLTFCFTADASAVDLNAYQKSFFMTGKVFSYPLLTEIKTRSLFQLDAKERNHFKDEITPQSALRDRLKKARNLSHDKVNSDWRDIYMSNLMAAVYCLQRQSWGGSAGEIKVRSLIKKDSVRAVRDSTKQFLDGENYPAPEWKIDDSYTEKDISFYNRKISSVQIRIDPKNRRVSGVEGPVCLVNVHLTNGGLPELDYNVWINEDNESMTAGHQRNVNDSITGWLAIKQMYQWDMDRGYDIKKAKSDDSYRAQQEPRLTADAIKSHMNGRKGQPTFTYLSLSTDEMSKLKNKDKKAFSVPHTHLFGV